MERQYYLVIGKRVERKGDLETLSRMVDKYDDVIDTKDKKGITHRQFVMESGKVVAEIHVL